MEHLENGALLSKNAEELIQWVADQTLAEISKYPDYELKRIGWYDSGARKELYTLTSTGVWINRTGTLGGGHIEELMNNSIGKFYTGQMMDLEPRISGALSSVSSVFASNMRRKIAIIPAVLVNGVLANVELVPALANYYGVIKIKGISCSAAINGDTVSMTFQDEDDVLLSGLAAGVDAPCAASKFNTELDGLILFGATDEKALEVDLDTGGGAGDDGKIIVIELEYWYET